MSPVMALVLVRTLLRASVSEQAFATESHDLPLPSATSGDA
jgi:hypothetical protein